MEQDPVAALPAAAPDADPVAWNRILPDARAAELRLPSNGSVLVVCAHPDDETIGAGRLIAAAVAQGIRVQALVATAGEACFHGTDIDPEWTAEARLEEWRSALAALGAAPAAALRLPDGGLRDHLDELVEASAAAAESCGAQAIWTTWRHDPHPDHEAAGDAATRVAERLDVPLVAFPVWTMSWRTPADVESLGAELQHLPLPEAATARRAAALQHYRTQLEPLREGWPPVVPRRMLDRHERQYLVVPRAGRASAPPDPFAKDHR